MRKVLFINSSIYLPGEGGYKRTLYLFDLMKKIGYDVTLLTGDFNHYSKQKRNVDEFYQQYPDYKNIVILPKNAYKRNISISRYMSDSKFSMTTRDWVEKHLAEYDVVYLNMPNIATINRISPICQKLEIPMVIDIRDLFPEALKVVLKKDWLYNLLTFPLKLSANKAYKSADEFVAVSKEYLERGMSVNKRVKNPKVVYIGATLDRFNNGVEKYVDEIDKPEGEFWIVYAGTIGASYDIATVITSVQKLKQEHEINVRFKILGQGPEEEKFKKMVHDQNIDNVDFLGFMEYEKMAAYLTKCDVTINCIKKNASQSIINKVADYFASGTPMLNSAKNEEMQWLIDNFQTGYNYEAENENAFIEKFLLLYNDAEYLKQSGINARKLAEERFDRSNSYNEIIETIDNIEFQKR